jgi:hypothetical protein
VPMADTNVVALSLGVLAQEPSLMTGEAVFCESCKAALSALSTLQTVKPKEAGDGALHANHIVSHALISLRHLPLLTLPPPDVSLRRCRVAEVAVRVLRSCKR